MEVDRKPCKAMEVQNPSLHLIAFLEGGHLFGGPFFTYLHSWKEGLCSSCGFLCGSQGLASALLRIVFALLSFSPKNGRVRSGASQRGKSSSKTLLSTSRFGSGRVTTWFVLLLSAELSGASSLSTVQLGANLKWPQGDLAGSSNLLWAPLHDVLG